MRKSQSALEFMVFIGIAVLILLVGLVITANYLDVAFKQEEIKSAGDMVKILKNEINLAARVENGYTREFSLPSLLDKREYVLTIYPREIVINLLDECDGQGEDCLRDFTGLLATEVNFNDIGDGSIDGKLLLVVDKNNPESLQFTKTSDEVTITVIIPP